MKLSDVSDKVADLGLAELHSLSEELRSLMRSKSPAIIEEYLAIAKGSFGSLPCGNEFKWSTDVDPDGFSFFWNFLDCDVFRISSGIPFNRFSVVWYGELGGRAEFFDSFTDAIQSLKTRCRNVVGLYSRLNKILNKKGCFSCTKIAIADGGYTALFEYKDNARVKRSVEVAIGPIKVYCDQGSHFVEKGKAHILLTLYNPRECEELVAPYEIGSEAEAITWIEQHADDLCNPDEFDQVFLSEDDD